MRYFAAAAALGDMAAALVTMKKTTIKVATAAPAIVTFPAPLSLFPVGSNCAVRPRPPSAFE